MAVERFLLLRPGHGVAAVEELARILQRIEILHDDRGATLVEDLPFGVPERLVVEIGLGLDVERRLLIARCRLVAETGGKVIEGIAQRLDVDGPDIDMHR